MKQFTKVCFATVIDSLRIRSIRSIMLHAYERVLCGWNCRARNDVNPQRMHNTNSSGANHTVLSIFQRLICALNSTNLKMSFKSKLKRKRERERKLHFCCCLYFDIHGFFRCLSSKSRVHPTAKGMTRKHKRYWRHRLYIINKQHPIQRRFILVHPPNTKTQIRIQTYAVSW